MKSNFLPITAAAALFMLASCQSKSPAESNASNDLLIAESSTTATDAKEKAADNPKTIDISKIKVADAKTILERKQVPVLCYHQIRDWKSTDSKAAKDYIIPVATFKEHMKMLADSGYQTILPDQYYDYLNNGTPLPAKPIMITFDDTEKNQYAIAAPEMEKYGFKAVFFIMTVSIGRPNYMTKAEIKELSDAGNVIGSHTWDHHNVKKYQGKDWEVQIENPAKTLEAITGKKVTDFAYPFGLWNPEAIPELKKRGLKSAYILATKRDENDPLYTIRRIISSGYWSAKTLNNSIKNSF